MICIYVGSGQQHKGFVLGSMNKAEHIMTFS